MSSEKPRNAMKQILPDFRKAIIEYRIAGSTCAGRSNGRVRLQGGLGYLLRLIRLDDAKAAGPVAMQLMQAISWINNLFDHHNPVASCACGARSVNSAWGNLYVRSLAT